MRVLVTGGGGFIGARLVEALRERNDDVVVTGRSEGPLRKRLGGGVTCVAWDPVSGPPPAAALANVDAVVNLAGEPVASGRWTKAKKARIRESRVLGTRHLVAGMLAAEPRPKVLVNASAIGYYGDRKNQWVYEESPPGRDFLAEACEAWEAEAWKARSKVRTAVVRFGIVLGKGGGAYPQMSFPFRIFAGGTISQGYAWMSWIHEADVTGILLHCLDKEVAGVFNATAPNPVSNGEFSHTLAQVLHRPCFAMVPALALRLIKGEFAKVITASARVKPLRTEASGYTFRFPRIREALVDLER
ncbi:MAG: TIGR01777 family oxidoreductase [Planctomycetota bacterium]